MTTFSEPFRIDTTIALRGPEIFNELIRLRECEACGAVVSDTETHDRWHEEND